MHILPKVKTQRQMAGPDDNVSLTPTDPEAPSISVGCAQSIEPTEAEKIAHVGATKATSVDATAAYVDVAGMRA